MPASYSYNPFFGPPPPDPNDPRAVMKQVVQHSMEQPRTAMFGGHLSLSPEDLVALEQAPKILPPSGPGTTVKVEAYPAIFPHDPFQHMYAQFDDGKESYIYRGGPEPDGSVGAGVVPAHLSRDYGKGERVLYQTFLPNVSAAQAIRPAQTDAARINGASDPYLLATSNSNSVIGGFTARQYGHRAGDARTPGFRYDLPDAPPPMPAMPPWAISATPPPWR